MNERHTGENIRKVVECALEESGIEKSRVLRVVTDSASNVKAAFFEPFVEGTDSEADVFLDDDDVVKPTERDFAGLLADTDLPKQWRGEDLNKRVHNVFPTNNSTWEFEIISVEDLFSKSLKYADDDTMRTASTVSARIPAASVEDYTAKRRCDDVKIILGDEHMLATSCDYFETMFYGNYAEKDKEEVALENVGASDFRKFLDVVYSSATQIDRKHAFHVGDRSGCRRHFVEFRVIE
ncbi:Protein BATH-36 [Aphelenchoides avenae]|nr:Protein BATH-36 [Aphelenchus avenae]